MSTVTIANIQLNSGNDIEENLTEAGRLIKQAAQEGAEFIFTPENTDLICKDKFETNEKALTAGKHPGIPFFSELARSLSVWILIGSMKIKLDDGKIANRSFLFRSTGQLAASYDKIHLFDVELPNGEIHKESDVITPGNKAVIANTPWKPLGVSICYDIRFPYLYRQMAQRGAEMIAAPAAFTEETGQAHWEVLLRARAIETGSFIIAPAQVGVHPGGRRTHGHSMIINPWGKILAYNDKEEPGFDIKKIDFLEVTKARHAIPSLQHDRDFEFYETKTLN